jgi:hypothetical protein
MRIFPVALRNSAGIIPTMSKTACRNGSGVNRSA